MDAAEVTRLTRLGARALVAERFNARPQVMAAVIDTLMDMAATGDISAAKSLVPFMNQGMGMPTETVHVVTPESKSDLENMNTADLSAFVQQRRLARAAAAQDSAASDPRSAA